MRCFRVLIIISTMSFATPAILPAQTVKGGRAYTKAKKQLAREKKELQDFATLLAEMDNIRVPRHMRDFWAVNANVRSAMKHEFDQANKKLEQKRAAGQVDRPETRTQAARTTPTSYLDAVGDWQVEDKDNPVSLSTAELTERMKAIIQESQGLERVLAAGEMDVMERYRFLLGEFLGLMEDEVSARAEELER